MGVDSRGRIVLARPDSIQVDFMGGTKRRTTILGLVEQLDGDNEKADLVEARQTGVLTVRVPAEVSNGGGESRWRLDALNDTVARFHANDISAELNHVVFGAHSAIPQVLGGALTGSSTPPATPITVATPENKAVLITTAEPTVAPSYLRRSLDLEGHRRPRVLVIDTGLRTASQGRQNVPEHAFLRSADRREPAVHLHRGWRKNPDVDAIDDEDEHDDDGSGTLDFEAGHGTFITGIVRQVCPDAIVCPAGVLSSFGEGSLARVRSTIRRMSRSCGPFDVVVMSFGTFCANDDPGLLGTWMPRLLGDAIGVAAAGNLQSSRPYFPAGAAGHHRCRRVGPRRSGVVHQPWQLGRRLCAGGERRQHVLPRRHRDARRATRAALPGVGALERHELRRPEGRRGDRPGDVRQQGRCSRGVAPAVVDGAPADAGPRRRRQLLIAFPGHAGLPGHAGRAVMPDADVARR